MSSLSSGARFGVVVLLWLLSCAATSIASLQEKAVKYAGNLVVNSKSTPVDFVPGGVLTKSAWRGVEEVRFNEAARGRTPYPEAETRDANPPTPSVGKDLR